MATSSQNKEWGFAGAPQLRRCSEEPRKQRSKTGCVVKTQFCINACSHRLKMSESSQLGAELPQALTDFRDARQKLCLGPPLDLPRALKDVPRNPFSGERQSDMYIKNIYVYIHIYVYTYIYIYIYHVRCPSQVVSAGRAVRRASGQPAGRP